MADAPIAAAEIRPGRSMEPSTTKRDVFTLGEMRLYGADTAPTK
jgi:hypothetical protein